MRTGKRVAIYRGPWPGQRLGDAVEIVWDDDTDAPFALQLATDSFDALPGDPGDGQWSVSVWVQGPKKVLEHRAAWRRVDAIPYMPSA